MASVKLTRQLHTFFPSLDAGAPLAVEATTVAEVVSEVDKRAEGFAFYVCDERGRLRTHVNIFVDGRGIADRKNLSDPVDPNADVFIVQALSGG